MTSGSSRFGLCIIAGLLVSAAPSSPAWADDIFDGHRTPLRHTVHLGAGPLIQMWPASTDVRQASSMAWMVELGYSLRNATSGIEFGAGVRLVRGQGVAGVVCPEAYAMLSVAPDFGGAWQPRAGLAVGITTAGNIRVNDDEHSDVLNQAFASAGSGFVATSISPGRFSIRRWRGDILALEIGTSFPQFGRAVRVSVQFLRLGVTF